MYILSQCPAQDLISLLLRAQNVSCRDPAVAVDIAGILRVRMRRIDADSAGITAHSLRAAQLGHLPGKVQIIRIIDQRVGAENTRQALGIQQRPGRCRLVLSSPRAEIDQRYFT